MLARQFVREQWVWSFPAFRVPTGPAGIVLVEIVERAGHVRTGPPINIPPVLRVHLVQHQREAGHEGVPLPGAVGLQIEAALLGQEAETERLRHPRVLHPPQRRSLFPHVHVHDVRQGHRVELPHLGRRLVLPVGPPLARLGAPGDGGLGELQPDRLGLAFGAVRDDEDPGVPQLLHGRGDHDLVVLGEVVRAGGEGGELGAVSRAEGGVVVVGAVGEVVHLAPAAAARLGSPALLLLVQHHLSLLPCDVHALLGLRVDVRLCRHHARIAVGGSAVVAVVSAGRAGHGRGGAVGAGRGGRPAVAFAAVAEVVEADAAGEDQIRDEEEEGAEQQEGEHQGGGDQRVRREGRRRQFGDVGRFLVVDGVVPRAFVIVVAHCQIPKEPKSLIQRPNMLALGTPTHTRPTERTNLAPPRHPDCFSRPSSCIPTHIPCYRPAGSPETGASPAPPAAPPCRSVVRTPFRSVRSTPAPRGSRT
mmetsp:Transcript_30153/g.69126  ORF Transcript_30153/g.69126 Transcript_30153/m.69126 type:complete len:475 (+) Transcript_30153:185-1609(+)